MAANSEEIVSYLQDLKKEQEIIEDQIFDIAYWMKGGLPLDQAYLLTHTQRNKLIKKIEHINRKMSGDTREFFDI